MRKIIFAMSWLVVCLCSSALAQSSQVTLVTYYPAPFGMYQEMRVMGHLGVGTTAPAAITDIKGATLNSTVPVVRIVDTTASFAMQGSPPISNLFEVSGALTQGGTTPYIVVPRGGNVGIKIIPSYTLDVFGTARIGRQSGTTKKSVYFQDSDIGAYNWYTGSPVATSLEIQSLFPGGGFPNAGNTVMNRYSGNVGVGGDPQVKLDVFGGTAVSGVRGTTEKPNESGVIGIAKAGAVNGHAISATNQASGGYGLYAASQVNNGIAVYAQTATGGRAGIFMGGNVGIGTATPAATLDLTTGGTLRYAPPTTWGYASTLSEGTWPGGTTSANGHTRIGAQVSCPDGQYLYSVWTKTSTGNNGGISLGGACRPLSAP